MSQRSSRNFLQKKESEMPCMCGDYCCSSCGLPQGNWHCSICGTRASDGCQHISQRTGKLKTRKYRKELQRRGMERTKSGELDTILRWRRKAEEEKETWK